MLERILITFGCFLLAAIVHILIFHYVRVKFRARLLELIFVFFFVIQIILMIVIPENFLWPDINYSLLLNIATFVNGLMLYLLLFFFYANNYFVTDRSISIRIMIELENSPQQGLSKEELYQYYNGDMIMDKRLNDMIYGQYVKLVNGKYINTKKGKIYAKVFKYFKKYLNLGKGG